MKVENGILTPSEKMWLYNEHSQTICSKLILGVEADESEWVEITSEEKARFEALWNAEATNPDEATTEDLYNALAELGVE